MNTEICYASATELASRIRSKSLSPVEILNTFLERIESVNPMINAIVTLADDAIERAQQAETAIMHGEIWGPLHGVPFTIKDSIDTMGIKTTRGSRLFESHVPKNDATVVRRLKDAGGILLGKTNLPEFALWWETDNLVFGRTENPWKMGLTPGGSSGGEAAAIASGLSPLGVGSDLGGSIRVPAHYCGIVGLKATHGRVPLTGHWPDTLLRFMHVGPMARTVRDIALGISVMSGADGFDHYSVHTAPNPKLNLNVSMSKLRIGWCTQGPFAPVSAEVCEIVEQAASSFENLGCEVSQVSLQSWQDLGPQDISAVTIGAEGGRYLDRVITGREDQLSAQIERRLRAPRPTLNEYLDAISRLESLRRIAMDYFSHYDLLLCPTGPVSAHPHGSSKLVVREQVVPGRNALSATIPADLTGSPAISVPFGWSHDGLPIGVQLIGRHFDEATVIRAALQLEATDIFGSCKPSLECVP